MNRIVPVVVIAALFVGLDARDAHAYLDPGTGSMILQGILGGLLVIGGGIGMFWRRLKSLVSRSSKHPS